MLSLLKSDKCWSQMRQRRASWHICTYVYVHYKCFWKILKEKAAELFCSWGVEVKSLCKGGVPQLCKVHSCCSMSFSYSGKQVSGQQNSSSFGNRAAVTGHHPEQTVEFLGSLGWVCAQCQHPKPSTQPGAAASPQQLGTAAQLPCYSSPLLPLLNAFCFTALQETIAQVHDLLD